MTTTPFVPCNLPEILERAKHGPSPSVATLAVQYLADNVKADLNESQKRLCAKARVDVAASLDASSTSADDVIALVSELEQVRGALLEALRMAWKLVPSEGVEAIELSMDLTRLSRLLPRPLAPAPAIDRRFVTIGQDPAGNTIAWFRGGEDQVVDGLTALDALAGLIGVTVSYQAPSVYQVAIGRTPGPLTAEPCGDDPSAAWRVLDPSGDEMAVFHRGEYDARAFVAGAPASQQKPGMGGALVPFVVRFPEAFRVAVPAYLRDTASGIDDAHDMGMPREAHESARRRISVLLNAAEELDSRARWGGRERPEFFASPAYLESPHRTLLDGVVRRLLTGELHLFIGLRHNVNRPQVGLGDVGDVELRSCLARIDAIEVAGFWGFAPAAAGGG